MHIIGLAGAKGSGKSTSFDYLAKKLSNTHEIMIAEQLKKVVANVIGIDVAKVSDPKYKEVKFPKAHKLSKEDILYILTCFDMFNHPRTDEVLEDCVGIKLVSPRHAAQIIGSDIVRTLDKSAHLRIAGEKLLSGKLNIVTDIRFPNELDYFKKLSNTFKLIYVKRDNAEETSAKDGHSSESHLGTLKGRASITLDNNGSIDQLYHHLDVLAMNFLFSGVGELCLIGRA